MVTTGSILYLHNKNNKITDKKYAEKYVSGFSSIKLIIDFVYFWMLSFHGNLSRKPSYYLLKVE